MTERGVRIDEPRRVSMIGALDQLRTPLEAEAKRVAVGVLEGALDAALAGKRVARFPKHLFAERWTCPCCRGGVAKRVACWSCAGLAKLPGRKADRARLGPCAVCVGEGKRTSLTFNPASEQQTKVVLEDLLGIALPVKDGKRRSDEEALKQVAWQDTTGLVTALLALTKASTMRKILVRIAPGPDGRIRTFYNPAGTETGRFSSSGGRPDDPQRWALVESTNLQNMPKREVTDPRFDVRRCFVPDAGCVFVEADLAGAEAWIAAACSGDGALLERLRAGGDIHRWTAAFVFKKNEQDVTNDERQLGKVARHALNYGMQWQTFARNVNAESDRTGVGVDAKQAKFICASYHVLHPQLENWWRDVQRALRDQGWLETCLGRRRTFFGRARYEWLGETHREAIAFEPQSTIADLLNRGLLRWWQRYEGKQGEVLMQVHDSLVVQAKAAKAALVAKLLESCLREEIEVHGVRLTVPVGVRVSEHWGVERGAV
jgi:DNA polymerase I-like protein with 3'-5' exonuclease and polymerase domains